MSRKTHTAPLQDRFVDPAGNQFILAGGERISVRPEHAEEAASIGGAATVRFYRFGPHCVFAPAPVWDEQRGEWSWPQ